MVKRFKCQSVLLKCLRKNAEQKIMSYVGLSILYITHQLSNPHKSIIGLLKTLIPVNAYNRFKKCHVQCIKVQTTVL